MQARDIGATDRVRRYVVQHLIEPARRRGAATLTVSVGPLSKALEERSILGPQRFPLICGAVSSERFAKENGMVLQSRQGPKLSSTTVFTFSLKPGEGQTRDILPETGVGSSGDGSLFMALRGILKDYYREAGGATKVHEAERESWER